MPQAASQTLTFYFYFLLNISGKVEYEIIVLLCCNWVLIERESLRCLLFGVTFDVFIQFHTNTSNMADWMWNT